MSTLLLLLPCVLVVDAEFAKALLGGESAWQRLTEDTLPPEQKIEAFADLADRLARMVPRRLLKESVTGTFPPQRGEVVRLEGRIVSVIRYDGKVPVYRCRLVLDSEKYPPTFLSSFLSQRREGHEEEQKTLCSSCLYECLCERPSVEVYIFTPAIPQAWKQNMPVQERAAAFGLFLQSHNGTPIFAAPAIEWYPDTWLGHLGFNVASFDQVPVSRVTELAQHDEETNRLLFKFTEADAEPFYGLLRAVSATPEGWLEGEAKKQQAEAPISVADLFNRPAETRGKPVLLRGTAKRIVPTPVADSAVHSLFGIDHYYQVFLFTKEAQGNPIVVCVRSLPEGMPIGDADDFSEEITVAAVPYKLWIYETPPKPHYAPLLAGRSLTWHPKASAHSSGNRQAPEGFSTFSFAAFCVLVIIWMACRFWARRCFR